MSKAYTKVSRKVSKKAPVATPQTKAIPGRELEMKRNNAGGVVFVGDEWMQLDRFLILGSEGGTYYTREQQYTENNAKNVIACIIKDGVEVVRRIVEISVEGRAPKNDPALFALALVLTYGNAEAVQAGTEAIISVARTGTHILHLASYVNSLRGWGRTIRRGFSNWYLSKPPEKLALQLVKYANRDGWTHKDILRLAHIRPADETHNQLFRYVADREANFDNTSISDFMNAVNTVKTVKGNSGLIANLISDYKLPWEVVPTEYLNDPLVWEASLPHLGLGAIIRNLAKLTSIGLLSPYGTDEFSKSIIAKFADEDAIKSARLHPVQILMALLTYKSGHGLRGNLSWNPIPKITDALDSAFYLAFKTLTPTGKRILIGLDVSGSMSGGTIAGIYGLSPRVASAAMCMTMVHTEENVLTMAFSDTFKKLPLTRKMTLEEVVSKTDRLPFSGTDCALPMLWANQNKIPVDAFMIYTDNETWAGNIQPSQALKQYRSKMGIDSKLIVCGMTATNFTIADPKDAGSIDIIGFDSAVPSLVSEFIR